MHRIWVGVGGLGGHCTCVCLEKRANEVAPVAAAVSYQPECCLAALVSDNSSHLLFVPVLGVGGWGAQVHSCI